MVLKITDSAAKRFSQMCSENKFPRVEIVSGGCNGFEKKFSVDTVATDDILIELTTGGKILIDPTTYLMIEHSVIDFKTTIAGSQFTIEIPEAKSTCGCGVSFSL